MSDNPGAFPSGFASVIRYADTHILHQLAGYKTPFRPFHLNFSEKNKNFSFQTYQWIYFHQSVSCVSPFYFLLSLYFNTQNRKRTLNKKRFTPKIPLQQRNSCRRVFLNHRVGPESTRHLADMSATQHIHTQSGLSNTAAHRLRQLAVQ